MNDEQVVEVMAEGMCKRIFASEWDRFAGWYQRKKIAMWSTDAAAALAALRAAGFDVYRPDDCKEIRLDDGYDFEDSTGYIVGLEAGRYLVVPVGGEG